MEASEAQQAEGPAWMSPSLFEIYDTISSAFMREMELLQASQAAAFDKIRRLEQMLAQERAKSGHLQAELDMVRRRLGDG